ncbi:hypothetical protein Tco_1394324 [Tanacetum coccineum]
MVVVVLWCSAANKNGEGEKLKMDSSCIPNTPYPRAAIRRIQGLLYTKILKDINICPYSKKSPIRRIPHGFITVKIASTPMEPNKALAKDEEADITPKTSHLHAVKRIFRYLKGQPKLGLWYPRDSSFDLEAFSDSDYARASLDRKSTIGAEDVAAACCGQDLWIQKQMLDYGSSHKGAFDVKQIPLQTTMLQIFSQRGGQTAIGKEFSNPLMAGSLPKTIRAKVSTASLT